MLKYTVMAWGERQPDIYLVSIDGNRDDLAGVSIPASKQQPYHDAKGLYCSCWSLNSGFTISMQVLVSGSVIAENKDDLLEESNVEDMNLSEIDASDMKDRSKLKKTKKKVDKVGRGGGDGLSFGVD